LYNYNKNFWLLLDMFDKAEISVRSGSGGDGSVHFRREMYVPFGGPDGGDGGKGGDVIFKTDRNMDDLRNFPRSRLYRAENGQNGMGQKKHGRNGQDLVLGVPSGTVVIEVTGEGMEVMLGDLGGPGESLTVAEGGKGGWGNTHYKSSTNQTPRVAQRGEKGEEKVIRLEMRLIADVGVIGYPNAGKSTLLAAASAARPKIAGYPFTTLEPVLGVVNIGLDNFTLAEIPGLIEGAHLGKGLGHDFLQHAMRTRIFIHLLSGTSETPVEDMLKLNQELTLYNPALGEKKQIIALNKIDLPEVQEKLKELKNELAGAGIKAHYISAEKGEGVTGLMEEVLKALKAGESRGKETETPVKVFRPRPKESRVTVTREGDEFVVHEAELERLFGGKGITPGELGWQLNYQLKRMGGDKLLEKAGAKTGDRIRCGNITWEWYRPGSEK
jgi:GTP-binding protein